MTSKSQQKRLAVQMTFEERLKVILLKLEFNQFKLGQSKQAILDLIRESVPEEADWKHKIKIPTTFKHFNRGWNNCRTELLKKWGIG